MLINIEINFTLKTHGLIQLRLACSTSCLLSSRLCNFTYIFKLLNLLNSTLLLAGNVSCISCQISGSLSLSLARPLTLYLSLCLSFSSGLALAHPHLTAASQLAAERRLSCHGEKGKKKIWQSLSEYFMVRLMIFTPCTFR